MTFVFCSRCGASAVNIVSHWEEWHGGVPQARYSDAGGALPVPVCPDCGTALHAETRHPYWRCPGCGLMPRHRDAVAG